MELKVIENPENPEISGTKEWVGYFLRHLKNPDDKEAYDFLQRQYKIDTEGRPGPKLAKK